MFINGPLYPTQALHNNECVFMPDKDRTNPLFPVVNDLTLEESLVRTTQLIFINYCQDNPAECETETGGDRKSPHLSLRV